MKGRLNVYIQLIYLLMIKYTKKKKKKIFDKLFTFPTMQEMLDTLINFNSQHKGSLNPENRLVGVLFESKDH